MNKTALIQEVSEQFDTISKKDMDKIISCVFEKMIDTLSAGDTLDIAEFGKFIVNEQLYNYCCNHALMTFFHMM